MADNNGDPNMMILDTIENLAGEITLKINELKTTHITAQKDMLESISEFRKEFAEKRKAF